MSTILINPYGRQYLSSYRHHSQTTLVFVFFSLLFITSFSGAADQSLPLAVSATKIQQSHSYHVERSYAGILESSRTSELGFQFAGTIENVFFDEGEFVKKGDILATMENSELSAQKELKLAELASAKANLSAATSRLDLSTATLQRHDELVKKGHTSAQLLDEIRYEQKMRNAELQVARTSQTQAVANLNLINIRINKALLRAPYDGVIQQRFMDEGTIVSPGQHVLHLIEKGRLQARIGIPLKMVEQLNKESSYQFKVGTKKITGQFCCTLPRIDRSTGTVTALFNLEGNALFAGSLTEMRLDIEIDDHGFWIPVSGLSESQRGLWSVMVVSSGKIVETRLVEIIHRGDNQVYVRGTLGHGDLLIDGGTSRVVPGQTVKLAQTN